MALNGLALAWEADDRFPFIKVPYESVLRECSRSIDFILDKMRKIQNADDKKAASYGFENLTDILLFVQTGFKPLFESIYPEEKRILSGFCDLLQIIAEKFAEVEKIELESFDMNKEDSLGDWRKQVDNLGNKIQDLKEDIKAFHNSANHTWLKKLKNRPGKNVIQLEDCGREYRGGKGRSSFQRRDIMFGVAERPSKKIVTNPRDVYKMMKKLNQADQESFWILGFDGGRREIFRKCAFIGGVKAVETHAQVVYRDILRAGAISWISVHNHPSGNITPSDSDISTTIEYRDGSKLLGLTLDDAIIIAGDEYLSFKEKGVII